MQQSRETWNQKAGENIDIVVNASKTTSCVANITIEK